MSNLTQLSVYKQELDDAVAAAHEAINAVNDKLNSYLKRLDQEPAATVEPPVVPVVEPPVATAPTPVSEPTPAPAVEPTVSSPSSSTAPSSTTTSTTSSK